MDYLDDNRIFPKIKQQIITLKMSSTVILSIGSNCGYEEVREALDWLQSYFGNVKASRLYRTPDINGSGSPYVNSVASLETTLTHEKLDNIFKEYEIAHGRDKSARERGIVPIDIDIVIFDDNIIRHWDYRQTFFQIGYLELAGSVVEC